MSLSVGGYSHPGYPHPGPMSHDFYQYQQMARYPDHCPDASYFQNWVLNGVNGHHSDISVSPESYGMCTPSPTDYHSIGGSEHYYPSFDRCIKRRTTANKKERRRTQSINTAFAQLRGCIPNVPSDTKLSKIKTLRLATSYIAYLMDVLSKDDPSLTEKGFKAELTKKKDDKKEKQEKQQKEQVASDSSSSESTSPITNNDKKSKGRTGWPQHVWASELKN
ncbi:heart- and neural crest derivatives-expressed protein 2-like [Saccostrea cucullata]|uniref:heart- and neural crest derivatives-expressed protein 2-like n=1 Tax=Saccostrea cuccullata TaxID=36930 RepID=UPI002ED1F085